jgi:hypothetical protein
MCHTWSRVSHPTRSWPAYASGPYVWYTHLWTMHDSHATYASIFAHRHNRCGPRPAIQGIKHWRSPSSSTCSNSHSTTHMSSIPARSQSPHLSWSHSHSLHAQLTLTPKLLLKHPKAGRRRMSSWPTHRPVNRIAVLGRTHREGRIRRNRHFPTRRKDLDERRKRRVAVGCSHGTTNLACCEGMLFRNDVDE